MANHSPTHTPPHVHHAEMPEEHPERHEHTDVSVRGVWITVGAILVTTIVVHVVLYFVFFAYESAQATADEAQRRSAIEDAIVGPPAGVPRLQGIAGFNADTPSVDNDKLRNENRQLIESYGQTSDGRTRIPVDRAMDLALTQNLFPARAPATQPAAGGAHGGN